MKSRSASRQPSTWLSGGRVQHGTDTAALSSAPQERPGEGLTIWAAILGLNPTQRAQKDRLAVETRADWPLNGQGHR